LARPAPDPLTESQTEELRGVLEAAREELGRQVDSSKEDIRPVQLDEPIGRLTRMDAMQQQKMAAANRRSAEARLRQVAAALLAIDDGEYGLCVRCEEPIGYARLKARPETRLCLTCREAREG